MFVGGGFRVLTGSDGGERHVVLEVLSHRWQIHDGCNADTLEETAGSNARDLQNLRSVDGTGSQDGFTGHTDS